MKFLGNLFDKLKAKMNTPKGKVVVDKITTGLLIFMLCSPILILGYILLWFVSQI